MAGLSALKGEGVGGPQGQARLQEVSLVKGEAEALAGSGPQPVLVEEAALQGAGPELVPGGPVKGEVLVRPPLHQVLALEAPPQEGVAQEEAAFKEGRLLAHVAHGPRKAEVAGEKGQASLVALALRGLARKGPGEALAQAQAPGEGARLAEDHAEARRQAVALVLPLPLVASREAQEGARRGLVVQGHLVLPNPCLGPEGPRGKGSACPR